jgi:4-amino-4-deoxy-L-arabinose transferase-like glycosyltransferase
MLFLCAIPLLVSLGMRDTWHTMENVTLASSTETFLAQHGWHDIPQRDDAWVVPTWRGVERLNKPPLAVWLNLLAWSDLTPATTNPRQLMYRSRLVSVGLGLIMLGAVFWLGLSVGNAHTGLLAAFFVGTTLLFQRQSRLASYDIHLASFVTFSVAAAWWAIGPHRPHRPFAIGRYLLGWVLSGVGLGAAIMSKGPLAYPLVILPCVWCIVLNRKDWQRNTGGMLIGLLVGTALAFPWYYHISTQYADAMEKMSGEYAARRPEFQTVFYYVGLLGLIWPWTVLFFGALFQPWGLAKESRRRQLMYAWGWMALIFIFFSIPEAKQQRYILPILPAVGLLFGAFWVDHQRISDSGHADKGLNWLRIPHWIMLGGAPVVVLAIILGHDWLLASDYKSAVIFGKVHPVFLILWFLLCSCITALGAVNHWQNKHLKAGYLNAMWALVFTSMILHAYSVGPDQFHPVYAQAQKFNDVVQSAPVRFLHVKDRHDELNEEFVFFSMRIIDSISDHALQAFLTDPAYPTDQPKYIMVLDNEQASSVLKKAGLTEVLVFNQDYHEEAPMLTHLWKYNPKR